MQLDLSMVLHFISGAVGTQKMKTKLLSLFSYKKYFRHDVKLVIKNIISYIFLQIMRRKECLCETASVFCCHSDEECVM